MLIVLLRQKYKAPLSIKSPEPRAKGDVDIRGGNYSKGLNKQDVNLTDRLLADLEDIPGTVYPQPLDALDTLSEEEVRKAI